MNAEMPFEVTEPLELAVGLGLSPPPFASFVLPSGRTKNGDSLGGARNRSVNGDAKAVLATPVLSASDGVGSGRETGLVRAVGPAERGLLE